MILTELTIVHYPKDPVSKTGSGYSEAVCIWSASPRSLQEKINEHAIQNIKCITIQEYVNEVACKPKTIFLDSDIAEFLKSWKSILFEGSGAAE